jgi:hypothetical protein
MTQYQIPSKATLDKYGLSSQEWESILHSQGDVCAICKKESKTGRYVTDHPHVKGYKKLPPEQRKKFVRGILCWWDNKQIVGRGVTIEKLQNAIDYLKKAEEKLLANKI